MTLYEVLIELSKKHVKIKKGGYSDMLRFDLDSRTLGKIICKGEVMLNEIQLVDGSKYKWDGLIAPDQDSMNKIIELYNDYKKSIPSENSQFSRSNFKALSSENLTIWELVGGMNRIEAQYRLEAYILLASMSGLIPWNNDKHWYWQSETDKQLILYRKWIKGE